MTLRPLHQLAAVFVVSLFSTILFGLRLLADVTRRGPRWVFRTKERPIPPAILTHPQFGQHHFVSLPLSQIKLHCVVNGPDDKELMLFVHGFPEFWFCWRHQLTNARFNQQFKCVAFDIRGYGESSKPETVEDYTIDKVIEDIDQLITQLGYRSCVLVSHDMGGLFCWSYATVHPERVDRLIVCNSPHPLAFERYMKTSFTQILKFWYAGLFLFPRIGQLWMSYADLHTIEDVLIGKGLGAKPGTFSREDIEAYKFTYNTAVALALRRQRVRVKTLLIWGTGDGVMHTELAHLSRDYAEDFTLHLVIGASHWVQQEEPEQVNEAILQFLADYTKRAET